MVFNNIKVGTTTKTLVINYGEYSQQKTYTNNSGPNFTWTFPMALSTVVGFGGCVKSQNGAFYVGTEEVTTTQIQLQINSIVAPKRTFYMAQYYCIGY